jgi:hypothetical protein
MEEAAPQLGIEVTAGRAVGIPIVAHAILGRIASPIRTNLVFGSDRSFPNDQ